MNIESAINEVLAYARDDTHGYQLRCRDLDYGLDCAGLMMLYASLVEGVPFNRYPNFHTWTERSVLTSRGWTCVPFSETEKVRGDILLREDPEGGTGHTVLYLGEGTIVGAEGNWDGRPGAPSGREIVRRSYYPYSHDWILRMEVPEVEEIKEVKDAVYRLYNPNDGLHHFTASIEEVNALVKLGWVYEGAPISTKGGTVQQYTLYNPFNGAHLVTSAEHEAVTLACTGWILEGFAFKTPKSGKKFYRLYNPNNGDHLYTASTKEINTAITSGWREEGLAFYGAEA